MIVEVCSTIDINLQHGLEVQLHDVFDEYPIDLALVVIQLIDYNDVMVHDAMTIMVVHMDQHLNILFLFENSRKKNKMIVLL